MTVFDVLKETREERAVRRAQGQLAAQQAKLAAAWEESIALQRRAAAAEEAVRTLQTELDAALRQLEAQRTLQTERDAALRQLEAQRTLQTELDAALHVIEEQRALLAAAQRQPGHGYEELQAAAPEAGGSGDGEPAAGPWSGWSAHVPVEKLAHLPPSSSVFCCNRGGLQPSRVQEQLAGHDKQKLNFSTWPVKSLLSICSAEMGQRSPDGNPRDKALWEGVQIFRTDIWPLQLDGAAEAERSAATLTAYGVAAAKAPTHCQPGVQVFLQRTALQGIEASKAARDCWKLLLGQLGRLFSKQNQQDMERYFREQFKLRVTAV